MNKIKVAVIGASGYAGLELVRLLARHPGLRAGGPDLPGIPGPPLFPDFSVPAGIVDLPFMPDPAPEQIAAAASVVFTAVPHQTAMGLVPQLVWKRAARWWIFSADFRIHDAAVYEEWYQTHTAPEYLSPGGLRFTRTAPGVESSRVAWSPTPAATRPASSWPPHPCLKGD